MASDWQASLGGQDAHLAEQYGNVMSLFFGSGRAMCADLRDMSGAPPDIRWSNCHAGGAYVRSGLQVYLRAGYHCVRVAATSPHISLLELAFTICGLNMAF
jgi:hypothetical protein